VRVGDWKLVASREQPWQLFDLAKDRTELHDVAADQPQRVAEMSKAYDAWAQRCGVLPWPIKAADAKGN
jgi:arylsulfatase